MSIKKDLSIGLDTAIALFWLMIFTVCGAVFSIINVVVAGGNALSIIKNVPVILMCGLTIYYGVRGYKNPESDLLKICFLCFAGLIAFRLCVAVATAEVVTDAIFISSIAVSCVIIGLATYMSGRLKREKESICIMIAVSVLLIALVVFGTILPWLGGSVEITDAVGENIFNFINRLTVLFLWVTMSISYVARFKAFRRIKAESEKAEEKPNEETKENA